MLEKFNLNDFQTKQFQDYFLFLISENQKYNLTAITKQEEVFIKHFEDSLFVSKFYDFTKPLNLLDVGSGAGFPAIPLAILYPSLKVTIVEPTTKKIRFLELLIEKLAIKNVLLINKRAEDLDVKYRNYFDVSMARALAPMAMLLELIIPYTKTKGYFFAMKSLNYEAELSQAENALTKLKCGIKEIHAYQLSLDMGSRVLIKVLKKEPTPGIYPRQFAQIKQKPL